MSNDKNTSGKPFFHLGDNFSSAFFGKVPDDIATGQSSPQDRALIASFITLLTDPSQRELKTEALAILRNNKAQEFLVNLIKSDEYAQYRKELIAACWESGLDFSSYLIFYTGLVINCEYPEALEAITVIDEMHNLTDIREREKAIEMLSSPDLPTDKQLLTENTLQFLRSFSA